MGSYILSLIFQMEAKQSPFLLPLCPEAHTTPSHENRDCAPCNPPFTPLFYTDRHIIATCDSNETKGLT